MGQSQLADKLVQALEGSSYCRETCRPSLLDSKYFFFLFVAVLEAVVVRIIGVWIGNVQPVELQNF